MGPLKPSEIWHHRTRTTGRNKSKVIVMFLLLNDTRKLALQDA